MPDNPYSSPLAEGQVLRPWRKVAAKLMLGTLKYFGAYLLGILACIVYVVFTSPYEFSVNDFNDASEIAALVLSPIFGLYFFFTFAFVGFSDIIRYAWWTLVILLLPFACELFVCLRRKTLRFWRPMWVGFPLGFLGTLGNYWMALSSL